MKKQLVLLQDKAEWGAECSKLTSDWGCMIRPKFPMDTSRRILIGQMSSTVKTLTSGIPN